MTQRTRPATPHQPLVTTANHIEGREIKATLGIVRGVVVRSPNLAQGLFGVLRSVLGGNIATFESICDQARQTAFDRMMQHANELGADAVIAMRYDATEFMQGMTEVLAYGTAVRLE